MELPCWNVNQKAHQLWPSNTNSVIFNTGKEKLVLGKVGIFKIQILVLGIEKHYKYKRNHKGNDMLILNGN